MTDTRELADRPDYVREALKRMSATIRPRCACHCHRHTTRPRARHWINFHDCQDQLLCRRCVRHKRRQVRHIVRINGRAACTKCDNTFRRWRHFATHRTRITRHL